MWRILPAAATMCVLAVSAPAVGDDSKLAHAEFNLAERRNHWAYQPVRSGPPPVVENAAWCSSPVDRFILAELEAAGLSPSPPADKRTLIRRLTFDLTGLPPSPEEIDDFLADESQDAYEKLVDRLLATQHYGERWARHWLDLVRYGETLGFEFDFDLYNAWRYRDYVIRAFNSDLRYDQFVIEHLAGDLLPEPRRHPVEGYNESILATGFFWMCEGKQTPVDIRQEQADVIENQIDALSKAFLAQTIACARCHDHKFDAISTRDYYALVGYLRSSRYQQAFIDPPERISARAQELADLKTKIRRRVAAASVDVWEDRLADADRYLLAAQHPLAAAQNPDIDSLAGALHLDAVRLDNWLSALRDDDIETPDHPLYVWAQLASPTDHDDQPFARGREAIQKALEELDETAKRVEDNSEQFENFRRGYDNWFITGDAFHGGPGLIGDVVLGGTAKRSIARFVSGRADSGLLSERLEGVLRSPTFTIEKPYIHFRVAGRNAGLNVVVDGNTLIMNPIYGGLTIQSPGELLTWQTIAVDRWIGHRAYVEVSDSGVPPHRLNPPPSTARMPEGKHTGYYVLHRVLFSDSPDPPAAVNRLNFDALESAEKPTIESLAAAYRDLMVREVRRCLALPSESSAGYASEDADEDDGLAVVNWLLTRGLLDGTDDPANAEPADRILDDLLIEYWTVGASLPAPRRAPALADGTGEDEYVFIRGSHESLGEPAPRRPPEALAGQSLPAGREGSGRLELARSLASPSNPLLARVMVNRLWQHHFGAGIVRTPDDFGRMGQPPTHPELLDYLATEFVARGWSIKEMHRLMLLTSTYRQQSAPRGRESEVDPDNRLLWRMPVRRLEAEAIRDAILYVSGDLNPTTYGPSVLPYLTPHMEGRGRPEAGPLNGDGRRSIYINARRNFLTPMFVAFDYPAVFTPVGRRSVSTNAAQALTLMNDPFVIDQSQRWAERVLREHAKCGDEQRVADLYLSAFGRPPSEREQQDAMEFLRRQADRYGVDLNDARVWADYCHVMFNVKEFIFVN